MKIRKSIAILLLCLVVCGGTAYGVSSGLTAATANKSVSTQTAEAVTDENVQPRRTRRHRAPIQPQRNPLPAARLQL